ncbi:hypothetical protein TSAR_006317 [Trichomalopsis sarcophagae]|uniref:Uncharacterized protein n=1 Tax=Trichomalopsis sarcophagae TaxID=543379 RepID=A0A232EEU9_9HYME|nr:hypothetical protein TSAR_006317 [Trichomalopsis sarcophagae]
MADTTITVSEAESETDPTKNNVNVTLTTQPNGILVTHSHVPQNPNGTATLGLNFNPMEDSRRIIADNLSTTIAVNTILWEKLSHVPILPKIIGEKMVRALLYSPHTSRRTGKWRCCTFPILLDHWIISYWILQRNFLLRRYHERSLETVLPVSDLLKRNSLLN